LANLASKIGIVLEYIHLLKSEEVSVYQTNHKSKLTIKNFQGKGKIVVKNGLKRSKHGK
jgi:hypothetical protein